MSAFADFEGETGAPSDFMPAIRCLLQPIGIDPSQGGRHHTEMEVIADGVGIACLGLGATDLLLDLFEPGFDIPSLIPL